MARSASGLWGALSERIGTAMGLNFPPERWPDLQRGLARAASEFGCSDAAECAEWILSRELTKSNIRLLASYLTVGETYFFRERRTFEALSESVLPELTRTRRQVGRRLRIWSAACCTGEEPYSLAILLSEVIPDIDNWCVTILATDINEHFLRKAERGLYGPWSFRGTPPEFKERYFQRTSGGEYAILPELKQRVTFAHLNLVDDVFPSLATNTNAMDLIFCRNVLMYFTPPQVRKAIGNLQRALLDGGWLVVSPSEASQALFSRFETINRPGVVLYRKNDSEPRADEVCTPPPRARLERTAAGNESAQAPRGREPAVGNLSPATSAPARLSAAVRHFEEGDYPAVVETLLRDGPQRLGAAAYSLLTRALANQGRLTEALEWCDRWIGADKLDAAGHYLRAVVLQELGQQEPARLSLQRAVYLRPGAVLPHFALGNLARSCGRGGEANKHFTNALALLRKGSPDDLLPESDGLTTGRLEEILTSLLTPQSA